MLSTLSLSYCSSTLQILPILNSSYCVKSVYIRSYSGLYFPSFGLNTERYSVRMRENTYQNNSEYGQFLRSVFFTNDTASVILTVYMLRINVTTNLDFRITIFYQNLFCFYFSLNDLFY